MDKFSKIKVFKFDVAYYDIADSFGNTAKLEINYKKNSFRLIFADAAGVNYALNAGKPRSANFAPDALTEIEAFAQGILARKHNINFAKE